jgi:phosphatidyl-myo-inositol alpha-mannosyltransferase
MGTPPSSPVLRLSSRRRRAALVLAVVLAAALVALALSNLNLSRVGHVLITATPGWLMLALVLMASSLVLRSISWHQTLRAALPDASIAPIWVTRATMIGVMTSALFPGRIGEPSRVIVLTRRLEGSNRRLLPVVAGTVFSQTLINLLALAILLAVTFTSLPLAQGNATGIATALAVPLLVAALVIAGPRLLTFARRSRSERLARVADTAGRALHLAGQGLVVFARPRYGATAVASQLLAWALQWLACYAVLLSLGLQSQTGLVAAAAILLAINLSAVLPATPSNIGVFQAACLVVLSAYGVGAGSALAYGILLQAVEVLTALVLGVPALLGEGLRWSDVRPAANADGDGPAGEGADADPGTSTGEGAQ